MANSKGTVVVVLVVEPSLLVTVVIAVLVLPASVGDVVAIASKEDNPCMLPSGQTSHFRLQQWNPPLHIPVAKLFPDDDVSYLILLCAVFYILYAIRSKRTSEEGD